MVNYVCCQTAMMSSVFISFKWGFVNFLLKLNYHSIALFCMGSSFFHVPSAMDHSKSATFFIYV